KLAQDEIGRLGEQRLERKLAVEAAGAKLPGQRQLWPCPRIRYAGIEAQIVERCGAGNKIAALQPRLQLRLFERAFRCYMRRQATGERAAHFLAEGLQAGDDGVERGSDLACLQIKLTARRQIGAGGFD